MRSYEKFLEDTLQRDNAPISVRFTYRDPSECQAELGNIARIAEVLSLSCIGQPLWDLCECQVIVEATCLHLSFS